MHIHRTAKTRCFTTLGNEVIRDSRLSFCARGILAYLLSLPDGQRCDIVTLTGRTPEGRKRVASAMQELEELHYLRRAVKQNADGRLYTEVDVFDTPQEAPNATNPAAGDPAAAASVDQPLKEQEEETTRPAPRPTGDGEPGRAGAAAAEQSAAAVAAAEQSAEADAAVLTRVARAEPRLGLGEALRLAPLVAEWRRRGASDLHITCALTCGPPRNGVHHPAGFIEARLRTKMPAQRASIPKQLECDECRAPIGAAGRCRTCLGVLPAQTTPPADYDQIRARGLAMARAAVSRRSVLALPIPAIA